ncbi:hypothetical protein BDV27DRAFT_59357 [Aspergillus caelatus]|uniref:Uncharacterized protein n=1 Tax=Aspergillus caelatus TaxID=61420 RepID=A0A5N6ZNS5_9EURO|nr:uncharacterized protein BDV27DRAFT_59357 [Aspergillus caelatus]KAE8359038.1 hypothetical protein BDV27DRAFT_59357 [Aspergillus caelatus]
MASFADLPAKCTALVHAVEKLGQELSNTKRELRDVTSELVAAKGVGTVLSSLVDKLGALLCSYAREQTSAHRQQQILEAILDSALAQLDLLDAQMDCNSLRRENTQLRDALQERRMRHNRVPVADAGHHTRIACSPSTTERDPSKKAKSDSRTEP